MERCLSDRRRGTDAIANDSAVIIANEVNLASGGIEIYIGPDSAQRIARVVNDGEKRVVSRPHRDDKRGIGAILVTSLVFIGRCPGLHHSRCHHHRREQG